MILVDRMLKGDPRALARLISLIENRDPAMPEIMEQIYHLTGRAYVLGITGPPGAGKSTLVDKMAAVFRAQGKRVGIVAIDPSSPFTGGALLGDRIRMAQHATDPGVFIRSLGSRGSHGGLSMATREVVRLLDAAGYEVVIVETVGVGQTELDIMELADTVVVVFVPESGDTIQTMKAGLTEIADIFVVNKCDRTEAAKMVRELKLMVELAHLPGWQPPVLATVARKGEGVDELMTRLAEHQAQVTGNHAHAEKRSAAYFAEFVDVLVGEIRQRLREGAVAGELADLLQKVQSGQISPYHAALSMLRRPLLFQDLLGDGGRKGAND